MAKIKAKGHKEIARYVGAGGETYVLTQDEQGRTRALHKWAAGATFTVATLLLPERKANGGPIFSDRPTLAQFESNMQARGFERTGVRR